MIALMEAIKAFYALVIFDDFTGFNV